MESELTFPLAAGGTDPPSYWFDAVEDNGLAGIDFPEFDPADFDPAILDDGYFGEIDRILESITSDQSKQPPLPEAAEVASEAPVSAEAPVAADCVAVETAENGHKAEEKPAAVKERIGDERYCKRPRNGIENRSSYCWHREREDRYRESSAYGRRPGRDWEESDRRRRDGDWSRKRGRDCDRRDRDRERERERDRESRGYWVRDSTGKLVFRTGPWEADPRKDAKKARLESLEEGRKGPVKEEKKELPVEELPRKYQLDVLEQAKEKNTIAFLETGSGKTLIAVLLIKSKYAEMLKQNRKMLAVFLVPKVPLVYQVRNNLCTDILFSALLISGYGCFSKQR